MRSHIDGGKLKAIRVKKGLTQTMLAARSGVSVKQISRIENGAIQPLNRTHVIYELIQALKISESHLYPTDGHRVIDSPDFLSFFLRTVDFLRIYIDSSHNENSWHLDVNALAEELKVTTEGRTAYAPYDWNCKIHGIWRALEKFNSSIAYFVEKFDCVIDEAEEIFEDETFGIVIIFNLEKKDEVIRSGEIEYEFEIWSNALTDEYKDQKRPMLNPYRSPTVIFDTKDVDKNSF